MGVQWLRVTLNVLLSKISGLPLPVTTRARLIGYAALVYLNGGSWHGLGFNITTLNRVRAELDHWGINPDHLHP